MRAAGFAALLLLVAALAFGPLAGAGFVGDDLPYLVRAAPAHGGGTSADLEKEAEKLAEGDGPLASASLRLSHALWSESGSWGQRSAVALRVENLLLLLGAAAFARLALRRALSPWAGMDGARAAAGACAVLLACHPLAVPAVASVGARGDLFALCLGAAAAAAFLHARQEKKVPWMVAAGLCVLAAGHASSLALLLPFLLAGLELLSARRGRSVSVRARTAATTFVVFGVLACLEGLTGPLLGSVALPMRTLRATGEAWSVGHDLGVVALPVPRAVPPEAAGAGAVQYGIAGAVLLAVLQPALVAARSAPRLWGWLGASAAVGLLLSLAVDLLPAAAVACAVLGVASTSLSGLRRILLPTALAASFVLFARGAAWPWIEGSRPLSTLRADLADARAKHGPASHWMVVDPPESSLELLLHPSLCAAAAPSDPGRLHGISREALYALAREPEFAAMREAGTVLLLPEGNEPGAVRTTVSLPAPRPTTGTLTWQEELRSRLFDADPWERRALRAVALPGVATGQAPRMGWRAGDAEGAKTGSRTGVWVQGGDAPMAIFDLARDPNWLFGARVHRVWLEPEVGRIASAELSRDVPVPPGIVGPDVRERTWTFRFDPSASPRPVHGEARLVLGVLDLASFRYVEISGETTFFLPADFPAGPHDLAWSLEWRAGESCVARASGRR